MVLGDISELVTYGITRDEVIRLVLTKTHSSITTLYYLLLDSVLKHRKAHGKRGASGATGAVSLGAATQQRPHSAHYASGSNNANGYAAQVIKPIPAPITRSAAPAQPQQFENLIQQQVAEQIAQQQQLERQEYRYRPKSASATRSMTPTPATLMAAAALGGNNPLANMAGTPLIYSSAGGTGGGVNAAAQQMPQTSQQRPLSAFAGRR